MFGYTEARDKSNQYRADYMDSIKKTVKDRQNSNTVLRNERINDILLYPEKNRKRFVEQLGWPLTEYTYSVPMHQKEFVFYESGINIYRLYFDIEGIRFYGIYFEQDKRAGVPLVIAQHGGEGTAELCSGLWDTTGNYNDMVTRILNKGINVFVPQLLLWNKERCGIDYNREQIDAQLKQTGSSIAAIEIYCIMKSIDYFAAKENIDQSKIGMVGLSYGGFYTLYTMAVDTRIQSAISSCWYNNRYQYARTDWTWKDSACFMDNEVVMLTIPRKLYIEVGNCDPIFDVSGAKEEYKMLRQMIPECCCPEFRVFDGTHEFSTSDYFIDKLTADLM